MINDNPINIQCNFSIPFLGNVIDIADECGPDMPPKLGWNSIDNDAIILIFLKIDIAAVSKHISVDEFLLRVQVELLLPDVSVLVVAVAFQGK